MVSIPDNLKQFVKTKITKSGIFDVHTFTVIPTNPDGLIPKRHTYDVLDDNTYVKYPELIQISSTRVFCIIS